MIHSPVTFVTHTRAFCCPPLSAVLFRKLTIIAIWTQFNIWLVQCNAEEIQKSHSYAETVQKFLWTRAKVLQSAAEFVLTRVNEVLVFSLESRCFARFRPGEHDVSKTSTLSLFLLCFRKEYFVFFTKLYILFQNAGYIIVYFLY